MDVREDGVMHSGIPLNKSEGALPDRDQIAVLDPLPLDRTAVEFGSTGFAQVDQIELIAFTDQLSLYGRYEALSNVL